MSLNFGPFQVDVDTGRVVLSGQAVQWGDKASQLFTLLVEKSPGTISKEEIFDKVWQGRVVTENSLYKTISKLRKELKPHHMEIESVFGEGYRIVADSSDEASSTGHGATNQPVYRYGFIALLLISLPVLWFGFQYIKHQQLVTNMKQLQQVLAVTKQAFISQINRRNELGDLLSQRFELRKEDSWEKRFYQLYDEMNEQELFLCQQTRAYTEGPLLENNQIALNLLEDNPEIVEALPLAQDLITHLSIWLNKYHRVFEGVDKMCLLYVGVEDGAKYPSDFDGQLDEWIEKNQ